VELIEERIKQIQRHDYKTGRYNLSDENGTKESLMIKSACLKQGWKEGQPLAVFSIHQNTYDQAVNSCSGKLKALLDYHHRESCERFSLRIKTLVIPFGFFSSAK